MTADELVVDGTSDGVAIAEDGPGRIEYRTLNGKPAVNLICHAIGGE